MKSVGIMGGTFNPIHLGHITIATTAYEQYNLDEIWVMPNHIPAYKEQDNIVSGQERYEMVCAAIKDLPYCIASDFELTRNGNTYTIDTLRLLKENYPEVSFYFIIGADSLFQFHKWKEADQIPLYATLLVAPRDEMSKRDVLDKIKEYNIKYKRDCFKLLDCMLIPCSSSDIRAKIKHSMYKDAIEDVAKELYLSPDVYRYIRSKHLYEK